MNVTAMFPASWRCDVIVHRTGGRNSDGDPVPSSDHIIGDCLVGRRSTSDPIDRSELTDTSAVMYAPAAADIKSTDTITVPASHWMAGEYAVDGDPGFWPLGTEVPLKKA